ncbi:5-formyltetrahydrofolate cyclo-ligase [Candidatus Woesearchaeota archaeon]|nr:5-formyltetrahydrofolate cyclo-ligase [Candidatus Woesearchaeota archaeon]
MKSQLKQSITEKRNSLSKEELISNTNKIKNALFNLAQYKKSKTVMFYVSFNSEVGTHDMIKEALKNKMVAVPKVENHEIEPSIIIDFDSLIPSKFGILEPIELMKVAYKNIDLVLVPGIAFDKECHRIGYGFGYYDKFLKKVPKAVKIGLAFDFQVVDKVPREEHDVPVDLIVTEKRVVECRKI